MGLLFFLNNILLGVGLAMDAFSVSLANGLHEPSMKWGRMSVIAGVFGGFQFLMPLIGWGCVTFIVDSFRMVQPYIPWAALFLLLFLGGSMVREGLRGGEECTETAADFNSLLLQGVATSLDALSVGFTIAHYNLVQALAGTAVIGIVTYMICMAGLEAGKIWGMKLAGKASVLGGLILIGIGLEIFFLS